ncbi:FAST kinase domain-containing protein 2 [Austrofundulus limnaeus]|uniref:FAST kinase domain-containing protein 2 n=1 Tax=Austrofundulus limnaeus TaxID=52670 RepID=A0A2I4ALK4_AUSLI|nr:PREDICTED: FAST kinase domain-containing protein 2-like [Austrofundulus limnaeus]
MEAFVTKVIENPNSFTLKTLLCVLKVYSSFNYNLKHRRQQFLDVISHALDSYLSRMNGSELLTAAYRFCLLNHFPSALLEQLLQTSVLEQIVEQNIHKGWESMVQMLDICLRLDRPPLPQPLSVPTFVLGNPPPRSQPVNPQLSQTLQSLLVGQTNTELQEMVVVENFYVLDGVLTKPPSNHTCVPETSSSTEEQRSPAESTQRIAVIYAPKSNFCYGTSNPRGLLAVKLRHLKILGFTPVLVTEQDLQSESEEDRTNLLRRLIFPEHTSETQPKMEQLDA